MWGIIGTWEMAYDGVVCASQLLEEGIKVGDALESAVRIAEDEPSYHSVGFGGLPNKEGTVETDAAFMNGDNFQIGSVAGLQDIKNPISVAKKLSEERFNNFLVGEGARQYAMKNGFDMKNMLTEEAKASWLERSDLVDKKQLSPYDGHDTVCMLGLDVSASMASATSTSGLFMKQPGRVGDTPISGSGFYVDSEVGGACATGLGEDLMKGCLAYEIVRNMAEKKSPQEACDQTLFSFLEKLSNRNGTVGEFSLIAMNAKGQWGVATNVHFPFVVATQKDGPKRYVADPTEDQKTKITAC